MNNIKFVIVCAFLTTVQPACVSKLKYNQQLIQKQNWEDRSIALAGDLQDAQQRIAGMQSHIAGQDERIRQLKLDSLSSTKSSTTAVNYNLQLIPVKLPAGNHSFELAIQERDSFLVELQSKFQKALERFDEELLSYKIKKGKLHISMSEQLLYESGGIKLNKKAIPALSSLTAIISKEPDIDLQVEGHTDNVPIRRNEVRDNWDLSVLRASTMVRVMIRDFKINPLQLTACGKGEYQPRASNNTAEGRAQNRRTEIIITPRLKSLDVFVSGQD